jgi:hypothetical protein
MPGTHNQWVQQRVGLDGAAVDARRRVQEDLLHVDFGEPVPGNVVVEASLDGSATLLLKAT